jgi:hypothetical protein
MPEHRLDEPDVGPVLQHHRSHGMPEPMAGTTLADPGRVDGLADHLRQPVGGERFAKGGEEQGAVIGAGGERGPDILLPFADPVECALADRDHPVLLALALTTRCSSPIRWPSCRCCSS